MRTVFSVFLLGFLLTSGTAKTIKVVGSYINYDYVEQKGEFLLPVQYLNKELIYRLVQWRVLFEDQSNYSFLLTPVNCLSFEVFYKDHWIKFISVDNSYNWQNPFGKDNSKIFMEVKVGGKVSLLNYYGYTFTEGIYFENGSGGGSANGLSRGGRIKAFSFFYKDKRLVRFNKSDWKKQLSKLLWKEEEFREQLKKIKRKEVPEFLETYNQIVGKQTI